MPWFSRHYDRLLLISIVVVPLVPMLLYKWYYSLDTWYVPWGETGSDYFDEAFEHAAKRWLMTVQAQGDAVYVMTDSQCPCAKPVLAKLHQALAETVPVRVFDAYGPVMAEQETYQLSSLIRFMPALPTALVVRAGELIYVGPLVTGNLCSQEADFSPPLAAYQGQASGRVYNWLSEGCYCRLAPERLPSGSVPSGEKRNHE